jgi:hypothetical protein
VDQRIVIFLRKNVIWILSTCESKFTLLAIYGTYLEYNDAITEAGVHADHSAYKKMRLPFLQSSIQYPAGLVFGISKEALTRYQFEVGSQRLLEVDLDRYPRANFHVVTLHIYLVQSLFPLELVHSFPRAEDRKVVADVLSKIEQKISENPRITSPSLNPEIVEAVKILRSLRGPKVGVQFSTLQERTGVPAPTLRNLVNFGDAPGVTRKQLSAILKLKPN